MTTAAPAPAAPARDRRFAILSANPGKRRAEIIYLVWFLVSVPLQGVVVMNLSYTHSNDLALISQACVMGLGALILPVVLRHPSDKGVPLLDLYAVRMGAFLVIWACLGGFVGTDPWYEVLHGHFAFNTSFNPNGVPFFMLPMTISVFGLYTVILGSLYRVVVQLLDRTGIAGLCSDNLVRHAVLCFLLAGIMPLGETFAYSGPNYCFDNGTGKWFLNVLIYGSWHFAALLFYTRWDRRPGERTTTFHQAVIAGFACVGLLMVLMALTKTAIAPHFVEVMHGERNVNDWSADNCLGAKPS